MNAIFSADDLMMQALDSGAEDFVEGKTHYEIVTSPEEFSKVREALEEIEVELASAEVTMIPATYVELTSVRRYQKDK
jgi:transcriptional/translational regulatory protein YebC/TACO1